MIQNYEQRMKKYLYLLLLFTPFLCIKVQAQESWGPADHSDKWIEGHELFIKTIDSVKVKLNYYSSTEYTNWMVFEAEFINLSGVNDILIDPTLIRYGATKLANNEKSCNLSLSTYEIKEASYIFNNKLIKKNTLEPKQSLFGYIILKRCKHAKELTVAIPINGRNFIAVFEKIHE